MCIFLSSPVSYHGHRFWIGFVIVVQLVLVMLVLSPPLALPPPLSRSPRRRMWFTFEVLAATHPSSRQFAWRLLWDGLVGIREA